MRSIFLAEECDIGFNDIEQLGNDCGDATEVSRPRLSAQTIAETFDCHPGDTLLRVHLFHRRYEYQVNAVSFQQRELFF